MNDYRYKYDVAGITGASAHNQKVMIVKGNKNSTDLKNFDKFMNKVDARFETVDETTQSIAKKDRDRAKSLKFANDFIQKSAGKDIVSFYQTKFSKTPSSNARAVIAVMYRGFVLESIYTEEMLSAVLQEMVSAGEKLTRAETETRLDALMVAELY